MAGIRLEHDIWVLVADGEKALFLRNKGDAEYPNLEVVREMHDDNASAEAPQSGNGANSQKNGVTETDWHRVDKERFAEVIAERLYKWAHAGRFQKIVLCAPPVVLGALRKSIHKEVAARVVDEVSKTLTNHTVFDIERTLTSGGAAPAAQVQGSARA